MIDSAQSTRRFVLALAIWREARGESLHGKQLVAAVIRNRVEDPRWPNSYVGVITQRLQFSAFNPGDPNEQKWPSETDAAMQDCYAAADCILNAPSKLTEANHYHAISAKPPWADESKIVAREGGHIFYKL